MDREILFRGKRADNGEWIKSKNQRTCSECGYFYFSTNVNTNYCCSCGAKMDEE